MTEMAGGRRAAPEVPEGPLGEPCECCDAGCPCGDCPDCLRERPVRAGRQA